jgi:hypothetical protein
MPNRTSPLVLGELQAGGDGVKIHTNPFIPWLRACGFFMILNDFSAGGVQ